jgi:small subunit ribosomal protein S4e
MIVREMLGFAKTKKEAKIIISQGKIRIDGKTQREERFPVGLMDVVSIPEIEKSYRILPSKKGLTLHSIEEDESKFKLCRIEDLTLIKGGNMQLNLHDGRNVVIKPDDSQNVEQTYRTNDTLKIAIPSQELLEYIKITEGAFIMAIGGKNEGKSGKITAIEKKLGQKRKKLLITAEEKNGKIFQTTQDLIFAVGENESHISVPEVD